MSTQLTFTIDGDPSKAIKALQQFEGQADKSATKAHASWAKLGSFFEKAGSQVGGEFGDMLDNLGQGFEKLAEHGSTAMEKLATAGAGLSGAGGLLTALGSKEQ